MCFRTTCPTCGKATWGGCGAHVEQALRGVPESERCQGHSKDAQPKGSAQQAPASQPVRR